MPNFGKDCQVNIFCLMFFRTRISYFCPFGIFCFFLFHTTIMLIFVMYDKVAMKLFSR